MSNNYNSDTIIVPQQIVPQQIVTMITKITHKGYIVAKESVAPELLKEMRSDLTVKPNVNPDFAGAQSVEPYPIFQESSNRLYIPRFYGLQKLGTPTRGMKFPHPTSCTNLDASTMTLRDYQVPIVEKTLDILNNGCGGGVLELYTGSGKTSIAIYIMCSLKVKTLIIVHKSFLLQQWVERIQQFAPKARIGVIQGTKYDVESKDVVIGMLQTLSMKDFSEQQLGALSEFGFVCVDETHHIGAEVFCRALPKVSTRYMLGLSATPIRKDGLTKVIYWYIGPPAYTLQRDGTDAQKVLVKKIVFKSDDMQYKREFKNFKGTVMLPQTISNVVEYEPRNAVIVNEVMYYIMEPGRQIMVISDRIQHLHHLKNIIDSSIQTKGLNLKTGLYTGQQKQKELQISEKANIIFSSYAMCREGLDIQSLNTIILSTSTGDVIQTCGRILRKVHDISPLVIDVADSFSTFIGQAKKREAFYKKSMYAVTSFSYRVGQPLNSLDISSQKLLSDSLESTKYNKNKQRSSVIADSSSEDDEKEKETEDDGETKPTKSGKFAFIEEDA